MKVALFTDTYLPQINGVSKTIHRLRNYLFNKNIDNILLMPELHLLNNEKEVYYFRSLQLPFYPDLRLALPIKKEVDPILNKYKPDVIHVVTEFSMGLSGLKWAKRHDVPIISSYHTNFAYYAKYYNYQFLSNLLWQYLVWFHNQCEINFCPSSDTLHLLSSKGINNLAIWGRGVDIKLFNPAKKNYDLRKYFNLNDDILLLYVGRIAPEKDLNVLFDAFKIVKNMYHNIKLIIAGNGPLIQNLKELEIPGIIFTGELDQEKLAPLYASCDIFVFPSTTETYGNVILEAMASGLPVVAPYCGGIKENLENGVNGLSHNPHDSNDLAQKILELIYDKNKRYYMSIKAREHAKSMTWENVLSVVLEGYYNTITSSKIKFA